MKFGKIIIGFLGLLPLISVSCSDSIGRTHPVKGTVTVAGKGLKTGSVTFWPDESKGNKLAFQPGSPIAEDGTYELFTSGKKGAPAGHYKVTIVAQTTSDSTSPEKAKSLVPDVYTKKETTTITVEVGADGSKTYDLTAK